MHAQASKQVTAPSLVLSTVHRHHAPVGCCFPVPADEVQATKEIREEFRPVTIDELEGKKRRVSAAGGQEMSC